MMPTILVGEKFSPKPGDVIFVRTSGDGAATALRWVEELELNGHRNVMVVVAPPGDSVELLDEARMAKLGWVRKAEAAESETWRDRPPLM